VSRRVTVSAALVEVDDIGEIDGASCAFDGEMAYVVMRERHSRNRLSESVYNS